MPNLLTQTAIDEILNRVEADGEAFLQEEVLN
jgi:hypothetical protein